MEVSYNASLGELSAQLIRHMIVMKGRTRWLARLLGSPLVSGAAAFLVGVLLRGEPLVYATLGTGIGLGLLATDLWRLRTNARRQVIAKHGGQLPLPVTYRLAGDALICSAGDGPTSVLPLAKLGRIAIRSNSLELVFADGEFAAIPRRAFGGKPRMWAFAKALNSRSPTGS